MKKIIKLLLIIAILCITAFTLLACNGEEENTIKVTLKIQDGFSTVKKDSSLFIKEGDNNIGLLELSGSVRHHSDGTMSTEVGKNISTSIYLRCDYDIKDVKITANGGASATVKQTETWSTSTSYGNADLSDEYLYRRYIFTDLATKATDTAIEIEISGLELLTIADKNFTLSNVKTDSDYASIIILDETAYDISEKNDISNETYKYFSSYSFDKDGTFEYVVKFKNDTTLKEETVNGVWSKIDGGFKLDYLDDKGVVYISYEVSLFWAPKDLDLPSDVYLKLVSTDITQFFKLA